MTTWGSPTHVTVVVCRGCCCGDPGKHPDTDHEGQLEALRGACQDHPRGRVLVSRCLGRCASSNVVVVRTRALGGPHAEVWLGDVHDDGTLDLLTEWIRSDAAPSDLPEGLQRKVIEVRRRPRVTDLPLRPG